MGGTLALSPKIIESYDGIELCEDVLYENVNRPITRIITSGSIVNVRAANKIGGWDNNLFIDEVDFEFCYKGIINGFKCINCISGIYLKHKLGEIYECRNPFYNKILENDHNYVRTYYIVRNRLYIWKKYNELNEFIFFKWYIRSTLKLLFEIIVYKNEKKKNLLSYYNGIKDYLTNYMGKKEFNY